MCLPLQCKIPKAVEGILLQLRLGVGNHLAAVNLLGAVSSSQGDLLDAIESPSWVIVKPSRFNNKDSRFIYIIFKKAPSAAELASVQDTRDGHRAAVQSHCQSPPITKTSTSEFKQPDRGEGKRG